MVLRLTLAHDLKLHVPVPYLQSTASTPVSYLSPKQFMELGLGIYSVLFQYTVCSKALRLQGARHGNHIRYPKITIRHEVT